jgi:hypothetical protein
MDAEGHLVNGQHRLSAARIVQKETGKMIWFWVAMNVAGSAARSMDQGEDRTVLDYMKREGVAHARYHAGIAAAICRKSTTRGETTLFSVCGNGSGAGKLPPIGMVMDVWKRNRSAIQFWANWANRYMVAGLPRPTVMASLLYHFANQDESRAREFSELLISGAGLSPGDPVLTLRERLRADRNSKSKLPPAQLGALVVKAWVAWMEGRPVSMLRWTSVGPSAEPFPSHVYGAQS